jgi:hypothetical protein
VIRSRSQHSPRPAAGWGSDLPARSTSSTRTSSSSAADWPRATRSSVRPWRPSWIGASCAPPAALSGSYPHPLAKTLRCLGQRSSHSNHCSPIPRPGCAPAVPWPPWQAPESPTAGEEPNGFDRAVGKMTDGR